LGSVLENYWFFKGYFKLAFWKKNCKSMWFLASYLWKNPFIFFGWCYEFRSLHSLYSALCSTL